MRHHPASLIADLEKRHIHLGFQAFSLDQVAAHEVRRTPETPDGKALCLVQLRDAFATPNTVVHERVETHEDHEIHPFRVVGDRQHRRELRQLNVVIQQRGDRYGGAGN